ncbi:MAG: hypothetical protein HQM16_09845 [Deltaproteobacteria bacterium]|nr:hypothetical protein [Deltaproteobacteria bacterium]
MRTETATSTTTTKTTRAKKPTASTKKTTTATTRNVVENVFPTNELNKWLSTRTFWNHDEWVGLLNCLRDKGYKQWTDTQEGQTKIGMYLETKRQK